MTKYQLSLHAEKLKRSFLGFPPKPYAVVTSNGKDIGRTEIREPCTDPDWCLSMKLEFEPSVKTTLKVSIYNWIPSGDDQLLAEAEFEATEVFQSPGHMQAKETERGTV